MSNYYENQILQAIDTVASSLISKVSFDKTILCSIENADNSANGIYTVNDGSSSFEAYSTNTDYKEGMSVYVLIPEGDYKNQKTIVSRYVATGENAVDYISPMSKFIKIEDFSSDSKETGLLANGDEIKTESLLDCGNEKLGNNAYNYIGISAKFRTELPKYTFTSGRYGLLLELVLEDKTTTILGFYNDEMYGNSYSYTFGSTQEIVFDLKNINQPIKDFKVYFVQDKNFRYMNEETGEDVQLPSVAKVKMNNNNNEVQVPLSNNLFVSDIQVSFGYKLEGINEESVRLYTLNKLTYSTTEAEEKTILLKYFVPKPDGTYTIIDEIGDINIDEEDDKKSEVVEEEKTNGTETAEDDNKETKKETVKVTIHWYRYKMDNGIEDSIAGIFWEEIQRNLFNYNFTPNKELSREKIKVIYEVITEIEEDVKNEDGTTEKKTTTTSKYLESNELVFENADAAAQNLHDVDLIRELKLECTDDSNGVYKLYNEIDNKIFNSENTKDRILNAVFDVYTSADISAEEVETNKVTWRIPKNNSMISPVDFTINLHEFEVKEGEKKGTAQEKITWVEDTDCYYCKYGWGCDYIGEQDNVFSYEGTDNNYPFSLPMHYCIGEYYSSSYNNNTIECIINRYGKEYKAEIEFIFGNSGTNGTYYTINIRLGKSYEYSDKEGIGDPTSFTPVPALTAKTDEVVEVIPSLYDEKGEEITDVTFSQSWKKDNEKGIKCIEIDGRYFLRYLDSIATKNEETNQEITIGDHYGILSFSTAQYYNEKRVKLESYFPVGIRCDDTITAYRGTTKVIYDVQGSNPIYQTEHNIDKNCQWRVKVLRKEVTGDKEKEKEEEAEAQTWENYAPYFKDEDVSHILTAPDMFFSDLENDRKIVIQAYGEENGSETIYYQQSLLYTQNRFGNQMLNDWDGKLKINEKGNYILSALVGAGKKDINNSFSGVLMGEVAKEDTSGGYTDKKTGLFGYGQGVQTFGFRTDGTAFLGKSGSGQITFNEEGEGIIASATGNTTINLKDGNIKLSNEEVNNAHSAEITIDSSGKKGYFVINKGSSEDVEDKQIWTYNPGTNLIYIGDDKYYLQSENFVDPEITTKHDDNEKLISWTRKPGKGVKIDLKENKIQAYDFELIGGQKGDAGDYTITITTNALKDEKGKTYINKPLTIGSNFSVSWEGNVTASNGDFAGTVTAEKGSIGGWTIIGNALYYKGNGEIALNINKDELTSLTHIDTPSTAAIIAPAGVSVSGLSDISSSYTYYDLDLDENEKIQYDEDGNVKFKLNTVNNSFTFVDNNLVLNIGKNFAVDTNGKLYVKEASINGYATNTDLTKTSEEFQTTIRTITSSLNSNIGRVENLTKGSISTLGVLGNNTVFLSQTYNNSDWKIVEGRYDKETEKFYEATPSYTGELTPIEDTYYEDLVSGKYYYYNDKEFEEQTSQPKQSTIPVYKSEEKIYAKKTLAQQTTTSLGSFSTNTVYLSVGDEKTAPQAYIYDSDNKKLVPAEDKKITIFSVSSEGLLYGANAVISGTIYATNGWFSGGITASEGTIGGWNITEKALYYGGESYTDTLFSLDNKEGAIIAPEGIGVKLSESTTKTDIVLNVGENFSVDTNGKLYSYSGTIADWEITSSGFSKTIDQDTYFVSAAYGSSITEIKMTFVYYKKNYKPDIDESKGDGDVGDNGFSVELSITKESSWDSIREQIQQDGLDNHKFTEKDTIAFNPASEIIYQTLVRIYASILKQDKILGVKKTEAESEYMPFSLDGRGNFIWSYKNKKDSISKKFLLGFEKNNFELVFLEDDNYLLGFKDRKISLFNFRTSNINPTAGSEAFGLSLNSEGCWDDFWNNALFTKKIFNTSSETSKEYVAFLRGFGSSSSSFNNVFLGCKSMLYPTLRTKWTTNSDWASTSASYNFYIKFNGEAKFNSLTVDNNISFPGETVLVSSDNWSGNNPNINISYISPQNSNSEDVTCAHRPNNAGLYHPAIKITNDKPLNYNVILSSNCGQTDSLSSVEAYYWVVGTDNSSSFSSSSSTYYYNFILSLSANNSKYYDYYPRQNLYYQVVRSSSNSNPTNPNTDNVYLFTNCSDRSENSGNNKCTTAKSYLGSTTYPWTGGYITSCVCSIASAASLYTETEGNTSDARLKDIQSDYNLQKALDIYNNLSPIAYKYKNLQESDSHSRTHIGFIAQEVEKQIAAAGLTSEEFAAVQIKNLDTPEPGCEDGKKYYLNYNEFHGLHVLKNQEQDKRIQELENRVQELEEKLREKGV